MNMLYSLPSPFSIIFSRSSRALHSCFCNIVERSCRSDSLGPCTCPWLRVSPSFRLLRAITKSCVSTMFCGVYANVRRCLCRRNLTSVTCQNVPGPPPAFPIVWEVGPGNEASFSAQPGQHEACTWLCTVTVHVFCW